MSIAFKKRSRAPWFQLGSKITTLFAAVKVMPTPPTFVRTMTSKVKQSPHLPQVVLHRGSCQKQAVSGRRLNSSLARPTPVKVIRVALSLSLCEESH
ncbi:hypothetical protein CRUP_029698 [Coryphaenoides rupestris]|nr:hypothetical protein CRUP_029698 [Coryphaenoides rupestris]